MFSLFVFLLCVCFVGFGFVFVMYVVLLQFWCLFGVNLAPNMLSNSVFGYFLLCFWFPVS